MLKDAKGTPVVVIQALPGTGKTTLASKRTDVIDFDAVFEDWADQRISVKGLERLIADPESLAHITDQIRSKIEDGYSFISNVDPSILGLKTDLHVAFANVDDYTAHLELVGRRDVLDLGVEVLESWIADYPSDPRLDLKPGQHLSDLRWS